VKIYACKKATNISIRNIKSTNATDIGATDQPAKALTPLFEATKIRDIKLNIIICPAVMFAKSLIMRAKGFVNTPNISIGIIIGNSGNGVPGGFTRCFQYPLFADIVIIINVKIDKTKVTDIFPVTLAAPGVSPNKLLIKIKKKTVSKNIVCFSCLGPIFDFIMSSLTNNINGSKKDCTPRGAVFFFM
jgi:hypothetical protein